MQEDIYSVTVSDIRGNQQSLNDYRNKVLLIVNTASKCGFTPQYKGLEEIYRRYKDQGFEVLAFPCNQFANQEPGTEAEIASFCETQYEVSFALFTKIEVNGKDAHPLYQFLKKQAPGLLGSEAIKWNFTKFLVDREGRVVKRFAPSDTPQSISSDIEALLNKS
jgi:glutathione peroxidase